MPDNASIRRFYLSRIVSNRQETGPYRKVSLGIGRLIADSFAILVRKFPTVLAVSFWPSLLGALLSGALVGVRNTIGFEDDAAVDAASGPIILTGLIDLLVYSTTAALLVQLTHDAKTGRPFHTIPALLKALKSIAPISLLILAQMLLLILAGLPALFIVGYVFSNDHPWSEIIFFVVIAIYLVVGVWAYSRWSVMPAAAVMEDAWFRGLGRSAALTKGYRWPIVATIAPVWICSVLTVLAASALTGLVESIAGLSAAIVLFAAANALGTSLVGVLVTLVYLRLREIKEGIGVDRVAEVFD